MKERPIIFSAPMVRALLDGSKTQTRRICKHAMDTNLSTVVGPFDCPEFGSGWFGDEEGEVQFLGPYGQPGDRLWVREAVAEISCRLTYRADTDDGAHCQVKRWTPSIHMPRLWSRILLEIVSVRVERLNDCSEADAKAEGLSAITKDGKTIKYGIPDGDGLPGTDNDGWPWCEWDTDTVAAYAKLWEKINGAGSWAANPWVWAITFRRIGP